MKLRRAADAVALKGVKDFKGVSLIQQDTHGGASSKRFVRHYCSGTALSLKIRAKSNQSRGTAVEKRLEQVSIIRAGTCQTCNVPERFLTAVNAML